MRKIIALWQNEMIKTFRKVSVIVVLLLLIPGIFGIGGFFKFVEYMNSNASYIVEVDENWINQELENMKSELADAEKKLAETDVQSNDYIAAIEEISAIKQNILSRELCIDKEISPYSDSYLNSAVNEYAYSRIKSELGERFPGYITDEENAAYKADQAVLKTVIDERSYAKYIDYSRTKINENKNLSNDEKQLELKGLDYMLKCDPNGIDESFMIKSAVEDYKTYKRSLADSVNYSANPAVPLSASQKTQTENALAVIEYKLENGLVKPDENGGAGTTLSSTAVSGMISVASSLILILLIIIAGGSVSQEISSGSIKSLIISPTKRWKIFTAKFLSILTIGVTAAAVSSILSAISAFVWFGNSALTPYIYASGGVAHMLSPVLYIFAQQFVELLGIIVFTAFAFMLSIITRNTAASVSIAIAVYFVGSTATEILTMLGLKGEWLKFIPFNNTSMLSTQFFPFSNMSSIVKELGITNTPSLTFSLIYIAVLLVCMLYTAFDSFTRRDI